MAVSKSSAGDSTNLQSAESLNRKPGIYKKAFYKSFKLISSGIWVQKTKFSEPSFQDGFEIEAKELSDNETALIVELG